MSKQRVHRELDRSGEEIVREKKMRKRFQQERPTLEQLMADGDYTEPLTQEEYWERLPE